MNRNGGVIALTVVGVLVAGGAAAALNTLVLHSSSQGSVASAEQFLSSGRSSTDPGAGSTPSATGTIAPVETEDSVAVSGGPSPAPSRVDSTDDRGASTPRATRTSTRRATVARVSSTTASPSEDDSESHSGSGGSGGDSDD